MATYIGEVITLTADFTDDSDNPANPVLPVEVSIYLPPDKTMVVDSAVMTQDSIGTFTYDYTTTVAGTHWYKIVTGDGSIDQQSFFVEEDFVNTDLDHVPGEYQQLVNRLRDFLDDTVEQNDLEGVEESTDGELYQALRDTFEEINYGFEPVTLNYNDLKEIPWPVLRLGATLSVLISKGIGSARNTLTYNDAGGITVKDKDKFGRYTVWFNTLLAQYRRMATGMKRTKNLEGAYGGIDSEYMENWW